MKLALELGGDVNAVDEIGDTALHGAAHIRSDQVVQFLVQAGARVNAKNKRGLTPLMIAEGAGIRTIPGSGRAGRPASSCASSGPSNPGAVPCEARAPAP